MTSFNNTILDNIYKKFLNNEELENKEKIKKLARRKYIPFVNTLWMNKKRFFVYNLVMSFFLVILAYLSFVLVKEHNTDTVGPVYFFTGVYTFLFIVVYKLSLSDNKEYIRDTNDNMLKKPLSKEDFKKIMSNFNNKIVEKVMKENNNELCHQDLKKLDDLLLNQEESLVKIEREEIEEVLVKIDYENILKKFKGDSKEEIMEELKSIGLVIKDEENIIAERNFYRALKEKNKEECVL